MIRPICSGLLVAIVLSTTAGLAHAEPFAMHTELRNFCCTDWIARESGAPNPGGGAFGFVGGVVSQLATVGRTVEQTLSTPPFDLSIPPSRVGTHFAVTGFVHPNPLFDTLSLAVSIDNAPGVFVAGGGPGAFEYCPAAQSPFPLGCAMTWPSTPGPAGFPLHGRIVVTPGPNQFGGAMGWLGSGLTGMINARNAPGSAATRFTVRNFNVPFSIIGVSTAPGATQPTAAGVLAFADVPDGSTWYATSMHHTHPSPVPLSSSWGVGRATGHVWTTGMVTVSVTGGAVPGFMAVTMTGSDVRATAGPQIGHGNLTLVSANLYQHHQTGLAQARGTTLRIHVPEPATAASVVVGAGALVLMGLRRGAAAG